MKGRWSIIPDFNNIEEFVALADEYDAAFEYNDFFEPTVYEDKAEMERRIKHFISLLDFDGQICYENEAYSSLEASDLIDDKRDGKLDSVAAMIILERFLKR